MIFRRYRLEYHEDAERLKAEGKAAPLQSQTYGPPNWMAQYMQSRGKTL